VRQKRGSDWDIERDPKKKKKKKEKKRKEKKRKKERRREKYKMPPNYSHLWLFKIFIGIK
jgi:hypothetical protein